VSENGEIKKKKKITMVR